MKLKQRIVYTCLLLIPVILWVVFFTSLDIVGFGGAKEAFWFDLFKATEFRLTNSYIFLIFKLLVIVEIILYGLYTFFLKTKVRWYYFILSLAVLSVISLIPYYISEDLIAGEFGMPWLYGSLGIVGSVGVIVFLEYLTLNDTKFFGAIGRGIGRFFSMVGGLFVGKKKVDEVQESNEIKEGNK